MAKEPGRARARTWTQIRPSMPELDVRAATESALPIRQPGAMTTWDERTLVEDAAARGTDDWLQVADFTDIARRFVAEPPEAIRLLALGLMAAVVFDGLMVVGSADEFGFHEWPVGSCDAIRQVAELWDPAELCPTPGAVGWFLNTEHGNEIGRAVLQREGDLDT